MVKISTLSACAAIFMTGLASPLMVMPRQEDAPSSGFDSNTSQSPQLTALKHALVEAPGYGDRQGILLPNPPDASNITFTFINNTVTGNTGGTIALSTLNNFPALIGTNVAMAVGFVNPCGLNVPHSHPRANEFLTVIQGELIGGLILELNPGGFGEVVGEPSPVPGPIPQVNVTLSNYKGMLFPQGETHFQFNPTCEPALFAAAFDNSDPGRTQIARNFFSNMPDDVVLSAIGGAETIDASQLAQLRNSIPTPFAVVIEDTWREALSNLLLSYCTYDGMILRV
ncbi:RmlC-like cupin domain-containing protein [Stachybotrys elegans]|uniref:RmlC-like cupin domain-containing protein n=1 Tax=Stachybotrys elegans TaxID=80388 RepID=A0A8K0SFV8_9HYPO|nr:RmlC-like cupin domain-containing protein [Stachybotrys elegans]